MHATFPGDDPWPPAAPAPARRLSDPPGPAARRPGSPTAPARRRRRRSAHRRVRLPVGLPHRRARDQFERLMRVASPLGLYAEEFDVSTGYHLGNFPQAFSHLALIEAAGRIILAEWLPEFQ